MSLLEESNKSIDTTDELDIKDKAQTVLGKKVYASIQEDEEDNILPAPKRRKVVPESHSATSCKSNEGDNVSLEDSNISLDLSFGNSTARSSTPGDPNKSTSNVDVVAEHYNSLEEQGLVQRGRSRIVYMRNFNNWIKSMLIRDYMKKVTDGQMHGSLVKVLDMCCGKGGDLLKWMKAKITHLICVDIAELSVQQCHQRYTEMVNKHADRNFGRIFTAEFITADCTKVRLRTKYQDVTTKLNFVSCQFAFHYSFETLPQAECMIRNASEALEPGGYFIGTIPDAYDLVSRWEKSGGKAFGNDIYKVEFLCDKPLPLFGAKYHFHLEGVVDCPEFLVNFSTFCKLAEKFDLELDLFERFDKYYERCKDQEGLRLLSQMQALETYPPEPHTPLVGQVKRDYEHASQYLENTSNPHKKIGTLSKSEWEAVALYAVFAFRKRKSGARKTA